MWNKKIAAIKQVREFCMERGYSTRGDFATYDNSAQDRPYSPSMGLKDAKDLVESLECFTENYVAPVPSMAELTPTEKGILLAIINNAMADGQVGRAFNNLVAGIKDKLDIG